MKTYHFYLERFSKKTVIFLRGSLKPTATPLQCLINKSYRTTPTQQVNNKCFVRIPNSKDMGQLVVRLYRMGLLGFKNVLENRYIDRRMIQKKITLGLKKKKEFKTLENP